MRGALDLLAGECDASPPISSPNRCRCRRPRRPRARAPPGFANVALLRRPADLDVETWLTRWHVDHTPVAIATQSTFGYTQNAVVRALTPDAPVIDAIVEELFPIEATRDLHAFFGAADDADLERSDEPHGGQHVRVRRQRRTSTPCRPVATCCARRSPRR